MGKSHSEDSTAVEMGTCACDLFPGETKTMSMKRKRHRSDSNAELAIHDGSTTDSKGRTMKKPFNLLEIYRDSERKEDTTTLSGHGPREKGARPLFEVYAVWFNGHLVAVAESRSIAGEKARNVRSKIPTGTEKEVLESYNKTAAYMNPVMEGNAYNRSHEELTRAFRKLEVRDKTHGADMTAEEIRTLAAEKGLISGDSNE